MVLERRRDGERLEGRAGLVGEAGGAVLELVRGRIGEVRGIETRRVGHREDIARVRVHHDRGPALGVVVADRIVQRLLGLVLDRGVERRLDVLAHAGGLDGLHAERPADRVVNDVLLAVGAAEHAVLRVLQAGETLVVGPDRADHLRGELALRIEPLAGRHRRDAGDVEPLHLGGDVGIDLPGQIGEARAAVRQRIQQIRGRLAEHLVEAHRGPAGVLHLIRRGDHVGGILGGRQDLAVAVEHAAALAGDGHRGDLLAVGLGTKRAALHPLQPERAQEREGEDQEERTEEQAQPAIDEPHGQALLEPHASGCAPG